MFLVIITMKISLFSLDFLCCHDIIGVHQISNFLLTFLDIRENWRPLEGFQAYPGQCPQIPGISKQKTWQ